MNIYSINNGVLNYCPPQHFKLEKQMQQLIENNLPAISELELVKSEFRIKNERIDTLAFNKKRKAFVIIEYKRDRNYSVIDQGISYLKLMLENKADCLMKYNEKYGRTVPLSKGDVIWSNCYIIFAAPDFTERQVNAACYKDLKIILWLISLYGDSVLTINEIKNGQRQSPPLHVENESGNKVTKPPQGWFNEPLWDKIKIIGKQVD